MTSSAQVAGPREVLAGFLDLLLRRDPGLLDRYAADAVHEFPFDGRRMTGRDQIKAAFTAGWTRNQYRVTGFGEPVVYQTSDPELIIAEYDATAEVVASGASFTSPIILVLRARGGEIASIREYFNPAAAT